MTSLQPVTAGRERTRASVDAALVAGRSVLLSGPAGIGKTHLARDVLAGRRAEGWRTVEIMGRSSSAAVPLGACAHLVPALAGPVPVAGLIASSLERLQRHAAAAPLMVLVDDADVLDDASALLVSHLVRMPGAAVLATARAPRRAAHPLTALVGDRSLEVVEVPALTTGEVREVAAGVVGAPPDDASTRWLVRATGGNALWVTELLRAAVTRRAAHPGPQGWRIDTGLAVGGLDRVLATRLGDLDDDQREAAELVAVGGVLPIDLLEKLVGTTVPTDLAAAGLVVSSAAGRTLTVRLAHPLHEECLLGELDGIRRRSHLRRLVAASGEPDPRDRAALVRLALWHAELGLRLDPAEAGWAASAVHWGLLELVRRHLAGERVVEEETGLAVGLDTAQKRAEAARRLAVAAWDAEHSFDAGLRLARAILLRADLAADMVALLGDLAPLAVADAQRAELAATHGRWLQWTAHDRRGAAGALARAEATVADPWRGLVASTRAGLRLQSGGVADALGELLAIAGRLGDEAPAEVRLANGSPLTAALVLSGRLVEGVATGEAALQLAVGHGGEDAIIPMAEILLSANWGKLALGRYEEVAATAHGLAGILADADDHEGGALFSGIEARCLLFQGRPATAAEQLRRAIDRHGPYSLFGFRPLLHTTRAWALVWTGQVEEARAEVREARRWHTPPRFFDGELDLVDALVLVAEGRRRAGAALAADAYDRAAAAGCWYYALLAAHLDARLQPGPETVGRLATAAARVDGPRTALLAEHGVALAAADADRLDRLAARAVADGERLFAVELLEEAVGYAPPGGSRARLEAELARLRAETEGARSPVGPPTAAMRVLTSRELEVAALAARGWTSPAISDELVISVRTVESHLYRVFTKLGVRDRRDLAAALDRRAGPA
ncbi:MAG TPA: LuxR C-terminal-related transcriptional regulator [Acidimicrobiales bacterium]|nr:LuxR C-terminal-related transcriptional regulator [Acidimicrobiales bacterium]